MFVLLSAVLSVTMTANAQICESFVVLFVLLFNKF